MLFKRKPFFLKSQTFHPVWLGRSWLAGRSYGPGTDVVAFQSSFRKIVGTATPCLRHRVLVDLVVQTDLVVRFVRFDGILSDRFPVPNWIRLFS